MTDHLPHPTDLPTERPPAVAGSYARAFKLQGDAYNACQEQRERAINKLNAILDLHQPVTIEGVGNVCSECTNTYPCPTIKIALGDRRGEGDARTI